MGKLTTIFKALSEPLRLRIIRLLLERRREIYGEELAKALEVPPYQLSRHLKVLRATGLINGRRQGRWVYYSLAETDGELMQALRRLMADAQLAELSGNGRKAAVSLRKPRRAGSSHEKPSDASLQEQVFEWDRGPAIPGIL